MVRNMHWKSCRLAFAACVGTWTLAGTMAIAQTPACNGKNVYPCSVGGTLLVLSKPTAVVLNNGSGVSGGFPGGGSFIADPQKPGFALTTSVPVSAVGP
jgi:hypothetical protein